MLIIIFVMILSSSLETSSSFRLRVFWYGYIRRILHRVMVIRRFRHCMRSVPADFSVVVWKQYQKLGSVPEAQNDMIFSIICENLASWWSDSLLLFGILLYRCVFIAQNAPDLFGSLIVSGIFIHIALQVILNIAVVVNLMPNTGVTLPFISYGGTSIMFLMAEMGLALSVSRQIKLKTPERAA